MSLLSVLLDRVHDEFPAVPEPLALRALSDAAKEFFVRSHAWQDKIPHIHLRENKSTYQLYPPDGTQIVALKDVRLNGKKIFPAATETPRREYMAPEAGCVTKYVQITPAEITFTRPSSTDDRVEAKAALSLPLNATTTDIPDVIIDEWGEAIAAGAKMRLVRQASQPWFAPDAATLYSVPFYTAINTAKVRAMTALGEAQLQVEMRGW